MRKIKQLLILLLLSYPALGQQKQVDLAGAIQVQRLLADEQVRLVHSQPWYAAGERLWFKAFVNKKSSRPPSRSLYVELRDANGTTLINQRLIVEEGMAHGDMLLPKELPSGSYTLLATTNWMKNFSDKQQHREQFLIVNSREVMGLRGKAANSRPLQVKFFPEANSLLADAKTKIAVAVTNAAGIGVAAEASIVNAAGDSITSFRTDNTGIGVFHLAADTATRYEALVQANGYQPQRAILPVPKQSGMALAVSKTSPEGIEVQVSNTTPWAYTLLAASGGKVYFSHKATAIGPVTVPWQAGPGEAVRLLLLNPGGLVEAEQLVMLRESPAQVAVITDRPQYGTRQPVTVTIQTSDGQGQPVAASLAVSVAGIQPDFHRPMAASPSTWGTKPADNLLLVHAADEGLWNDILTGKSEPTHKLEQFVSAFAHEGVAVPFARSDFSTKTDTAFVQALPESVAAYAKKHYTRSQIGEVYGLTEPHAVAPLPRLAADRVFKLDNYITFDNVEEAIKEVTTNVRMQKSKGRHTVRLLYVAPGVKRMMKKEPLYLVDGVVVDGMEEILALDLNDIASIEIAWSEEKLYAGNLGHMVDNGLFAVYTKSGEARERLREKGNQVLYGQYNFPLSFVASTSNSGTTPESENSPDFKQVVFWNPLLAASPDGKTSFTFFTSDETGTFKVRVQGQTAEGIPVSGELEYEVKLVK